MEKNPPIVSYPSTSLSSSISTATNNTTRVLGRHEYKAAALSLAEAFKKDDVAMYFVQTSDRELSAAEEWNLHVYMMEKITYAHCLSGLATAIGPNYDCVALWMPPGKNMDDLLTQIRSGIWKFKRKLSKEGNFRFYKEFLPLLHNTKHEVLGEADSKSWYLVYIGTRPGSRGKGYAKTLIEYTTKKADAKSQHTYLECSNAANLNLYNKLGFELVKQITLDRGTKPVELDIMARKPATDLVVKRVEAVVEGEGGGEGRCGCL